MAKSGSFVGSTSLSQSKFLPVVYWSTNLADTNGDGVYDSWKVDVYVNYKCYDLYLGSIGSQYITISVDGGGIPPLKRLVIVIALCTKEDG